MCDDADYEDAEFLSDDDDALLGEDGDALIGEVHEKTRRVEWLILEDELNGFTTGLHALVKTKDALVAMGDEVASATVEAVVDRLAQLLYDRMQFFIGSRLAAVHLTPLVVGESRMAITLKSLADFLIPLVAAIDGQNAEFVPKREEVDEEVDEDDDEEKDTTDDRESGV